MKASADTRLMSRAELVPELFGMESETGVVPGTGIESTVGFEINLVVGSRMLTGLESDRSSQNLKKCHHQMVTLSGWPKQTERL
jgi:hypothetical protein